MLTHTQKIVYLHGYGHKFISPSTHRFLFPSCLSEIWGSRSSAVQQCTRNSPVEALQYFPGVTQPLGGSREGYQLPLINRVGMPDVHLPEQGR